jgi:hypothetical protein
MRVEAERTARLVDSLPRGMQRAASPPASPSLPDSGEQAGTCDRECCAWTDDGSVVRYREHLDCRWCGAEAEGYDELGHPACAACRPDDELAPLRSFVRPLAPPSPVDGEREALLKLLRDDRTARRVRYALSSRDYARHRDEWWWTKKNDMAEIVALVLDAAATYIAEQPASSSPPSSGEGDDGLCPACDGRGCEECGGTGQRVTTTLDLGDGVTARVTGSAPLSTESEAALAEVMRTAYDQMRGPNDGE